MIQRGHGAGFQLEALAARRIVGEVGRQDFERNIAAQAFTNSLSPKSVPFCSNFLTQGLPGFASLGVENDSGERALCHG